MNDTIVKVLLAIGVGILVGLEREYHEKAAGLRVIPLVCVGATLFTLYGGVSGNKFVNPQVAAGVVTGVGFLGAGVILRDRGQVTGLTTAATIWTSAALGMGIGLGDYLLVGVTTALMLLILWTFPRLNIWQRANDSFAYDVIALYDESRYKRFFRGYDEVMLLSEAELRAVPWLMIEALVAEAVFPIAATGNFGKLEGLAFLQMVQRKVEWMQQSADRLVELASG